MKLNVVPARTGIQWVKLGIRTFARQPLALTGLFFMYFFTVSLLAMIPVVGTAAALLIAPAATLGMMAAAEVAANGKFPMPTVLLTGFRGGAARTRGMLVLGMIYAVVLLGVILLASLFSSGASPVPAAGVDGLPAVDFGPGTALIVAVQLPLLVVFAHAPALVFWHGLTPAKSLFFSGVAFLRNFMAYLVFALCWVLILMAVLVAFRFALRLAGVDIGFGTLMPLVLIMASIGSCSLYFTYRDTYQASEEANKGTP